MTTQDLSLLAERYPIYIPLREAAPLLGLSPRQLSRLIADGREPFASLGANVGLTQCYTRIYTGRLLRYLTGGDLGTGNPVE